MNWLHFSDFHVGRKEIPERDALGSILDATKKLINERSVEIDAVFLVGDIAYSGLATQYELFADCFLSPLRDLPQVSNAKVFAVPGNHDVDCNAATPITWEGIRPRNQSIFFGEGKDGLIFRRDRARVFTAYRDFVTSHDIYSPDPFEEVTKVFSFSDLAVDLALTNTSFFSDYQENSSDPITPSSLPSIRSVIRQAKREKPMLLVGHHPISCFLKDSQIPFRNYLSDNQLIYLHGHLHEAGALANGNGSLRELGFGASYITTLEEIVHLPFRNTFALCQYNGVIDLTALSWDPTIGRWENTTRNQFSCYLSNPTFDSNRLILQPPFVPNGEAQSAQPTKILAVPRKSPTPTSLVAIGGVQSRIWDRFLAASRVYKAFRGVSTNKPAPKKLDDGRIEYVIENETGEHLILCIPGAGHILSEKEVVSYNTRLDTDGYESLTVFTFGKLSSDARSLYVQLSSNKSIEILTSQELISSARSILSATQLAILEKLDAGKSSVALIASGEEIYLAIIESRDSGKVFYISDGAGVMVPSTDPIVNLIRLSLDEFSNVSYLGSGRDGGESQTSESFVRATYLAELRKECDKIKYSALSTIGLRIEDYSLSEIYVEASASEVGAEDSRKFEDAIDDYLAAYPTSHKLKEHIKSQIKGSLGDGSRQEVSLAREFCQEYGSVLVTGDPGSGKTCFVKHEIISYCKAADANDASGDQVSWYSRHIPLFLPLSQAATLMPPDDYEYDFLELISLTLERRGFAFQVPDLKRYIEAGRVAFFFDGLDEVVSVERRASIVQKINSLVALEAQKGNRFVVTSRPAAVHVVNLLPSLKQLTLHGLSKTEIRTLATSILSVRVTENGHGPILDQSDVKAQDRKIVDRIVEDSQNNPGVARIAQNPLLLTLLVLIYANAGAPSAKRHLIYGDAIKTLSAVRGREDSGHDPVSVQDLRERLGAVALSVYRGESGLLPTRKEVSVIIQEVMTKQLGRIATAKDANDFIQRVAESTGLIAVGTSIAGSDDDAPVTFMHHSFLEYFAASALSKEIESVDIAKLVETPRWHEVISLLSGILGETNDVGPIIRRILSSNDPARDIDGKMLRFSIGCALECEVPSEGALLAIAGGVRNCIVSGPARFDPWVRSELGNDIGRLLLECGGGAIEQALKALIDESDPHTVSAAIRVASYATVSGRNSEIIRAAISEASTRTEDIVLAAVCTAVSRAEFLQSDRTRQTIERSLKRGKACKVAALEAIARLPSLAEAHWPEIINGIDDSDLEIRRAAGVAAIQAGLNTDVIALTSDQKKIVSRALESNDASPMNLASSRSGRIERETVEKLYNSGIQTNRLLGIDLLAYLNEQGELARDLLIRILEEDSGREEWLAALRAFKNCHDARLLCRGREIRVFIKAIENGTSDVKQGAVELLGYFGADQAAVRALLDMEGTAPTSDLARARSIALGRVLIRKDEARARLEDYFLALADEDKKRDLHSRYALCASLVGLRELDELISERASSLVRRITEDKSDSLRQGYIFRPYLRGGKQDGVLLERRDDSALVLREHALLTYCAVSMPSSSLVDFATREIGRVGHYSSSVLARVPGILVTNCRRDVQFVLACVKSLEGFREATERLHRQFTSRSPSAETGYLVSELRSGIEELRQLLVTFDEFLR